MGTGPRLFNLTPTVRNLGYLLLCRDDLRQIVDHVRSLPDLRIDLEVDYNRLDDVETDLPNLGDRLSYFTLKAYRETETKGETGLTARSVASDGPTPTEVLSLRLTESACTLATTTPDPETRGVIGAIEDIARQRRRVREIDDPYSYFQRAASASRFSRASDDRYSYSRCSDLALHYHQFSHVSDNSAHQPAC
jgi:hypothetical protein